MRKCWVVISCVILASVLTACEAKPKTLPMGAVPAAPSMTVVNGKKVSIDYTLTVDGQVVDSSQARGPLTYMQGQNQMIPGLEKALLGLKVGDEKSVVVAPGDAYGEINPEAVQSVPRSSLPQDIQPQVGMALNLQTAEGQQLVAVIKEVQEENILLDLNHPLAGKTLSFTVKVVKIE